MYGTAKYMHRVDASAMQNSINLCGMKVDTEISSSVLSSCACFRKLHATIACFIPCDFSEAFLHEKLAQKMQLKLKSIIYLHFILCLAESFLMSL